MLRNCNPTPAAPPDSLPTASGDEAATSFAAVVPEAAGAGSAAAAATFAATASLLAVASAALRWVAIPPALPDLDSSNFARALTTFDLVAQSPHFPGYPLYVAAARLLHAAGAPELTALSLPGVLLAPVAVIALAFALRREVGPAGALAGAAVLALAPLAVLAGGSPASDGAGLALLSIAAAAVLSLRTAGEANAATPAAPPPTALRDRGFLPALRAAGRAASAGGRPAILRDRGSVTALLAGAAMGAALGLRPSYLVAGLALVAAAPAGRRLAVASGAALLCLLWGAGVVVATGPAAFLRLAPEFLQGHAGEWGGTVLVAPELGGRLRLLAWDVFTAGLGLPGPGAMTAGRLLLAAIATVALLGLAVAALRRSLPAGSRRLLQVGLLLAGPYGLWAFFGQNLLKARHALPLVLAAALLLAAAAPALQAAAGDALRARRLPGLLAPALAAALLLVTLPLAIAHGTEASPAARLVEHVTSGLSASGTQLLTGDEGRLLSRIAPRFRVGRPADAASLPALASRLHAAGVAVYVTSSAPGAASLAPQLEEVARFRCDPLLRSHASDLTLFRFHPALASAEVTR